MNTTYPYYPPHGQKCAADENCDQRSVPQESGLLSQGCAESAAEDLAAQKKTLTRKNVVKTGISIPIKREQFFTQLSPAESRPPESPRKLHHDYRISRRRMVQEQLLSRGIRDSRVLEAMLEVPRHLFVPEALQATAYDDRPLPIGMGQTISQPYVVAHMCQLLKAAPGMRVLEIGTGSGYQAAVLSAMGLQVYSVERLAPLFQKTRRLLLDVLHLPISLHLTDGTLGWLQHAPFDRIIVAAGGPSIPEALVRQLKDDGILVIPVGDEKQRQSLIRVSARGGRICTQENCGAVTFVDLVGSAGW